MFGCRLWVKAARRFEPFFLSCLKLWRNQIHSFNLLSIVCCKVPFGAGGSGECRKTDIVLVLWLTASREIDARQIWRAGPSCSGLHGTGGWDTCSLCSRDPGLQEGPREVQQLLGWLEHGQQREDSAPEAGEAERLGQEGSFCLFRISEKLWVWEYLGRTFLL